MKISLNGRLIDDQEAVISIYDHGFLYGMGLFETFRTYEGRPFLLAQHLERLTAGCEELGISFEPDQERVHELVQSLLQANGLEDGYFRYTITAGDDLLGLPGHSYERPTEILYVKGLPPRNRQQMRQGKALQLLDLRRNTPEGTVRLKSLHYMNNILAKREMLQYPWTAASTVEGLMLTEEGYVAEGIVSNIFFVSEGKLCTPALTTGILPGITRQFIMDIAVEAGVSIEEGLYTVEQLQQADEILMTNSIQEISPVHTLWNREGTNVLKGGSLLSVPGLITEMLMNKYQQHIGSET
ncbi:aminodeoxychorismate lyase [Paenibacillus sp. N1-5-1-14]|uniref:aminodeoxychorismate lyase n=1 Tax=Paenibacillus radicibacter TaxID=2972488 RepID=UPI002158DF84|nr:aminodeoxychorismate lyase [Paenibacillus radicibacter]MCR8645839.1 aminodeoxychorismate lyase [Paenibacillus radicibacter]